MSTVYSVLEYWAYLYLVARSSCGCRFCLFSAVSDSSLFGPILLQVTLVFLRVDLSSHSQEKCVCVCVLEPC